MSALDLLKPQPSLRVFVSAGASGIGLAIAQAFLDAHAHVSICDVDSQAIERALEAHPGLHASVADVANREQVDNVIDEAARVMGGLDVLVNNAGIAGPTGAIEALDAEQWERTVSTNLDSQFYFLRRAVPWLKRSPGKASIIAMSSVAGRLGYAYRTPYASTKWAIVGLVKSLAVELGPSDIRVNAILPGVVEGERMNRVIAARAEATGVEFDVMRDEYLKKISLRRMVTMEDIAAMALFLASPAGGNVTGQAISVDGNVEYL